MTIAQFRNDPDLVAQWADNLKSDKLLQLVLQVMEDSHPDKFGLESDKNLDVSPTMANIQLGKSRGYTLYGGRLKMLAQPLTQQEMNTLPESEYQPEQPERVRQPRKKK